MKLSLAVAALLLAVSAAGAVDPSVKVASFSHLAHGRSYYEDRFLTWMAEFGTAVSDSDYERRLQVFSEAEDRITEHNAKEHATFTMAHNAYSHLTWAEFRDQKGIGRPLLTQPNRPLDILPVQAPPASRRLRDAGTGQVEGDLPNSVDWKSKGGVTPVKNQGSCGSCWSFSTTGAMEGAYFVKTGQLKSFSEQMLVDCDTYDSGCNGGLMDYSFHWIQKNGGICEEDKYPYTGADGVCSAYACTPTPGTGIQRWVDVDQRTDALMEAVTQQPVSIAIEADEMSFQFYSGGVLTEGCGTNLDHGVLLAGYGTENGIDYWLVKNSWGADWGSEGYIKLLRGGAQEGGECGILESASYPILTK